MSDPILLTDFQCKDAICQCFPTLIIANDGTIVYVNQAAESLFGYMRKELINRNVVDLLPIEIRTDYETRRDAYFRNPSTRPTNRGEIMLWQRKDTTLIPIVSISTAFFENTNQYASLIFAEVQK